MGNASTKDKGSKVAIMDEESPQKAEVKSFSLSPEQKNAFVEEEEEKMVSPQKKSEPLVIETARPKPQETPPPRSMPKPVEKVEATNESTSIPAPQVLKPLAPVKKLKPLGWEINDTSGKGKVDAAERENILKNKRIELDKKRLERKMEKQRQKELELLEKEKSKKENATIAEKAAEEEQKTTQQLLEEEEARCMECIKQMCSPTISYNLTSDQWAHRKEGVEQIQQFIEDSVRNLKQLEEGTIIHQFCSVTIVLRKFFQDRVAPVFFAAYDCFRCLLNVYGKYIFDSQEVMYALQSVIPPLIVSMGGESTGTNRRTQRESCRCVLRIARLNEIDGLGLIVQLMKVDTIPLRPRLALLKILLQEFSLDDENSRGSRLTLKLVFDMCEPALNHSDDKIRKAGVEDIVLSYKMVGSQIRQYICDVKPAMLKLLEEKFAEVDGNKNGNSTDPKKGTVSSPSKNDGSLSQIQRDKQKKRGKKGGENIKSLLNPVVLTKTSSSRGDTFTNSLQNHSSTGSFLDEMAKNKNRGVSKDNAAFLSSSAGGGSLSNRLNGRSTADENPERDSPPSPKHRDDNSNVYRGNSNLNRALFADLAEGSYGNGGNNGFGGAGFSSPSGRSNVESRFHIRD